LWIRRENFYGYFEMMGRFKSLSDYVRRNRKSLRVDFYLPENEIILEPVKKKIELATQPTVVRTSNVEKKSIQTDGLNDVKTEIEEPVLNPITVVKDSGANKKEETATQGKVEIDDKLTTSKNNESLAGKCEESMGNILKEPAEVNILVEEPKKEEKKRNFVFGKSTQRNIEVRIQPKIDGNEEILKPNVVKEVDKFKVVNSCSTDPEIWGRYMKMIQ
jgi:hypothetical protein